MYVYMYIWLLVVNVITVTLLFGIIIMAHNMNEMF